MKLNEISDKPGARKGRLRVGRGIGSGRGKTAGRGVKGQKSRSGVALKGFEGGQMPLHRRLPKRGFNNYTRKRYVEVGLDTLQKAVDSKRIDAAKPVTGEALKAADVITHLRDGVRVLGNGEIKAKLTLEVAGATKSAIAAIEAAGGSVTVTAPGPAPESGAEQAPASAGAEAPAAATPEETGDEAKPEGDDA